MDRQELVCERLKKFGYTRFRKIRLYGEEVHLTSDPVPEDNGFSVEGITTRSATRKRVRIPLNLVRMVEQELKVCEDRELSVAA
jgi:hypothetical protein